LIFVFDPLAIALILMTNRVFELEGDKNPLDIKNDSTKEVLETIVEELKHDAVNDTVNDTVNDAVTEVTIFEDEPHEEDVIEQTPVPEIHPSFLTSFNLEQPVIEAPVVEEAPAIEETKIVSEKEIEVPVYKKEPVIPTGKIEVEDIREIKENRGYSKPIPAPKNNNTIERIGANKVIKNGDNNKFFFKRNK
jgi:hypothetical protein